MSQVPPSIESVESSCAVADFDFEEIAQVREKVYRGKLAEDRIGDSRDVYIKVHDEKRKDRLEEFAQHASDVGHPPVHLIDGEHLCLLMGTAEGRPLSRLLPVVTVPGIWRLYNERMEEAYHEIGRQIGTLHEKTRSETGPLLSDEQITTALERTELLTDRLESDLVERTRRLFEEARDQQTCHALTYGDRSPHNIYWNGDRVTHIDATCKRRSVVADHASALMGVRLMIERLPYARKRVRQRLEEAYWEGYAETGIESSMNSELCAVRYVKRSLALLSYYDSKPRSLNTKLTRRIDPPIVIREIRQTVSELDHL